MDKDFLKSNEFRIETIEMNIKRAKLLAVFVILMELALSLADVITSFLKVDARFQFSNYLIMYIMMIGINIIFLIWASTLKDLHQKQSDQIRSIELVFIVYLTFFMCWGSVLTLMDQKLYGELAVFIINMLICLVIYNLRTKMIIFPFVLSCLILIFGLPFFQKSTDILIGHYVNLTVFLILIWIASRIMFNFHYKQMAFTLELSKSKSELEAETKINIRNNARLKEINRYLKKLSMLDELTRLPNRRSFRSYIDYHFEKPTVKKEFFSVIMIDVDHFKQLNDQHGHAVGDRVLKKIAKQINFCASMNEDFAARWGGDEFICVSFNRSADEMANLAGSIRDCILSLNQESAPFKPSIISVSMGVCLMEVSGIDTIGKCIENADKALYAAKAAGRNCIRFGPGCLPVNPADSYST